jgi:hypothetical protein
MTNVGDNNSPYGGVKTPQAVRDQTQNRILAYAKKHYSGKYTRIDVRFQGLLCYIDAYLEPYVPYAFDPSVVGGFREAYKAAAKYPSSLMLPTLPWG